MAAALARIGGQETTETALLDAYGSNDFVVKLQARVDNSDDSRGGGSKRQHPIPCNTQLALVTNASPCPVNLFEACHH